MFESPGSSRGRFRRGRVALLGAVVAGLALLGGACTRSRGVRELRVVLDTAPGTLDPYHHNEVITWSVLCNVYDALVQFSSEMRLRPALAVSWRQLDPTHVRFDLRRGVRFQDGSPFGAGDVVASFERARSDPASRIRHQLLGIVSVTAVSDDVVVVETAHPAPTLLNRLAFLFIVPRSQAGLKEITSPVGTGPYRVAGRSADGTLHLEAWDGWHGLPPIGRVAVSFVEDTERRMELFTAGKADIVNGIPDSEAGDIRLRQGCRLEPLPRMAVQILTVTPGAASGAARRALSDVRVRRAMLLAIDRRRMVSAALGGNGTVASQYVHPVVNGYDPSLAPLPYDPGEARRLLAEAGFAGGFDVELGHAPIVPEIVRSLVGDLAAVGVRVHQRSMPFAELVDRCRAGTMPLAYYARTCTTGDASDFLNTLGHTRDPQRGFGSENVSGYSDPGVDALLEAADGELDGVRRLQLLQDAQRRMLEDLPILPLTVRWGFWGASSRVDVATRHDDWLRLAGCRWRD